MKGIIYKIQCNKTNKVYFGSTKQCITAKMEEHQQNYNEFKMGKNKFAAPFECFRFGDYKYTLLDTIDCDHEFELKNITLKYIEENDCINRSFVDKVKKKISKAYRDNHKEEIKESNKAYREANKEKIKEYKKAYREANKEKINEHNKAYKEANKEKINEKRRQQRADKKQSKE